MLMYDHNPSSFTLPPLSTTAYVVATYLNSQLSGYDLSTLGSFFKTLGEILELDGKEKMLYERNSIPFTHL